MLTEGFGKFNPSEVTGSTLTNNYNVITEDLDDVIFDTIQSGYVVSGRSTETGKVTMTINALTIIKYFANTS